MNKIIHNLDAEQRLKVWCSVVSGILAATQPGNLTAETIAADTDRIASAVIKQIEDHGL